MKKAYPFLQHYRRRPSHTVMVGGVAIGSEHPIRLQSMTNTDTNDTEASVEQIRRIAAAGGEIVRLSARDVREAAALGTIRRRLDELGVDIPLVADIHFQPAAALEAALHVEKVRINPGNFNDRTGQFDALVERCRRRGVALRIGVNHGSLAPAIVERYGDTPRGMVASALEWLERCREQGFDQLVVSMKSSNVRVMVQAYRLLVSEMDRRGMTYPLHLGVTEAGDDQQGRVKSAVGIGALLGDGVGDTIRVSLTESPEREILVARRLVDHYLGREALEPLPSLCSAATAHYHPFEYTPRPMISLEGVGQGPPRIGSELSPRLIEGLYTTDPFGAASVPAERVVLLTDQGVEPGAAILAQRAFFLEMAALGKTNPVIIRRCYPPQEWESLQIKAAADIGPLFLDGFGDGLWIVQQGTEDLSGEQPMPGEPAARVGSVSANALMDKSAGCNSSEVDLAHSVRSIFAGEEVSVNDRFVAGRKAGSSYPEATREQIDALSLSILQAARVRISRAEFIACPGCGRTQYNLEHTLALIQARTAHLKGIKIGVMGCIVNGPGEMADADYGYVGAAPGEITLYRGQQVVRRHIPQADALDALVRLIREDGLWHDPL